MILRRFASPFVPAVAWWSARNCSRIVHEIGRRVRLLLGLGDCSGQVLKPACEEASQSSRSNVAIRTSWPSPSRHMNAEASWTASYPRKPYSHARASARLTNASVTDTLARCGHSRENRRCARRPPFSSTTPLRTARASAADTSARLISDVPTATASAVRATTSSLPDS